MSGHDAPVAEDDGSFVSKFLRIAGVAAVTAIGVGVVLEAPIVLGAGVLAGIGVGVSSMMSGGGDPPTTPKTEPSGNAQGATTKTVQDDPIVETVETIDPGELKTRIAAGLTALAALSELTGGTPGNAETKELRSMLAGLDGQTTQEAAQQASTRVNAVLEALPRQLAASVIAPKLGAEVAPFRTGGPMDNLEAFIGDAETMLTLLTTVAASLSAGRSRLSGERYVLQKGGVVLVKGMDDPALAPVLRGLADDADAAMEAAAPFPAAIRKAKIVQAESAKGGKGIEARKKAVPELRKAVDTLLALRDGMPKTAEAVVAGAEALGGIKDRVVAARNEAKILATHVAQWKASDTADLDAASEAGKNAVLAAENAAQIMRRFELDDAADQRSGGRIAANMESIMALLDEMDQARQDGANTGKDREATKAMRDQAILTAGSLREAVDECVDMAKTLPRRIRDVIDALPPKQGSTAKKKPRAGGDGPTAPKYKFVAGTPALTDWGLYDDKMQSLIKEITNGGVGLSDSFELSFTGAKNHSQGARLTKVYLDTDTMGGSTVIRGYFRWSREKDVVTVTPIAVTQEHGPHENVLMGAI